MNRPRISPVIDHATGGRICAHCWADIDLRPLYVVFCSDTCRHRAKARRQRKGYQ